MSKQRIGTFLCWLFGHKFMMVTTRKEYGAHYRSEIDFIPTDTCVRCGVKKND